MFSKKGLVPFVLSLTMALTACTPEVGEKPPEPENFELSSTKCFNQAADDLKKFFSAEATDAMLLSSWSCLETAFLQFEKYIQESNPEGYTSQEIVDFLEKNFFDEKDGRSSRKISPGLQAELMKLKRMFIGGSDKFVTRDELRNSRDFLQKMSKITRAVNPFMKVIVIKWKPDVLAEKPEDHKTFDDSHKALQIFAKDVAEIIKSHEADYKLNDAVKLAREFEKFFGEDWDWIQDLEDAMPGVKKLKVTLAGGTEEVIKNREWTPVLNLGARGYFQFLRYHYFIKATPETGSGVRLVYIARTLEDVFSIFQDLISQRSQKKVTRKEVYEILKAFERVWKDLKVSEKLILEIMKIKKALIGGEVDHWSVKDFETARLKVPELRKIVEKTLPILNILMSDWDPDFETEAQSRKIFADASRRFYDIAKDVGAFMEGSYSYADAMSLLQEFEKLYPGKKEPNKQKAKISETLKKFEDLFVEVNKALFNRPDTVITTDTWPKILPLVARFYSIYQYYDYFMADKNFKQTQTLQDLGVLVDNGVEFAESILAHKSGRTFSHSELVQISTKLSRAGILPESLRESTYKSLWTAVLQHLLFDPARRIAGEKNSTFGKDQLVILKKEFHNWRLTQIALNKIFQQRLVTSFKPDEMMKVLKETITSSEHDPEMKQGLTEVYNHLDTTVTKTLDAEDQLQISNKVEWLYQPNSLFQANLSRMISRLLIQSFSSEKELGRVSECEARAAFFLLVDVFRDLKIFDPSDDFIDSRFLEANIFMSRGNGDKFLDISELSDLVTVIFSGLKVHEKLEDSLRRQCEIMKNDKGKEFITFKCMSEHHYVAARKYMGQMPEFKAYLDKLSRKDVVSGRAEDEFAGIRERAGFSIWNSVFRSTLKATGWKPNKGYGGVKQEAVYLHEALYYPFVVHYIELLYSRFDQTKNNILQTSEARKAFPTFRPLLKELAKPQIASGMISEGDLLAVFTFILRYQQEPSLSVALRWIKWKTFPSQWDVWVSRTEMASILGYIADKAATATSGPKCNGSSQRPPSRDPAPQQPEPNPNEPEEPFPQFPDDDGGNNEEAEEEEEPFPQFPDFPEEPAA